MLHAMLDYAHSHQILAEPGFKPKTVRWLIVFSDCGKYVHVVDTTGGDKRSNGRLFSACPDLSQPEMVSAGSGCRHFLVDNVGVVALLTKDDSVDDKQAAMHDYFVNLLRQAATAMPILAVIAIELADDNTLAEIRQQLVEGKAKPTDLATFVVGDEGKAIVEQDDWRDWWRSFRIGLAEQRKARGQKKGRAKAKAPAALPRQRCLLSGELTEPLPTHNTIEGLAGVGGLSMGDTLISFDKEAFCSFGLRQGANAAMSEGMVKTYVAALNDLIKNRSRSLAGVKVVYWYSGTVEPQDDIVDDVIGGFDFGETESPEPDATRAPSKRGSNQAESRAARLLDAIRTGRRPDLADCRYYALTLSANSGRVVIRDWMEGPFEDLAASVACWFDDLSIVSRDGLRTIDSHKFNAVVAASLRDLKDASAPMVAVLWRCAVKRQRIPHQIMAQTLSRVRLNFIRDEPARHARLGLLKAYCLREERIPNMNVKINEYETNPAYLCGRIMAILARIQMRAMPTVGVGIVQRYYAAASATPALVLGRLVRNAQIAYLPKIDSDGLRHWFENQLADVWSKLNEAPPRVLTLEEQTLFAMGYYHQLAKRGGKAAENDTKTEE